MLRMTSDGDRVMTEREVALRQAAASEQDGALARGLREGKPEAAQELCERFGPKLFAFLAARFPGDRELAQDLLVQSLTDVARKIRWYHPKKAPFVVWLYGVARGQIRAELRKRRRRKSVPLDAQSPFEDAADTSDGSDIATETAKRVDAQRQVALLSSLLSELEFDVLALNCIDQLSAKEIGLVVGRSERAVHSLLHRARTKARERLVRDE